MPIGTLNFKYCINNFSISKQIDTRINVKEDLEFLRLGASFGDSCVGVSYISSPGISVANNILIVDDELAANKNAKQDKTEQVYLSNDVMLNYAGFEVADIFRDVSGILTPFYYWHDLSSYESISNLSLLDANMEPVSSQLWYYVDETPKLQISRKGVYTNLTCSVIDKDQQYEIFYLRFLDNSKNETKTILLNSKQYYNEVSFLDKEGISRSYIVNQIDNNFNVKILFNSYSLGPTPPTTGQRYAIRRTSKSKIFVEAPGSASPTDRWLMRISPGTFLNNGYKYSVPEYLTQVYNPAYPYRVLKEKQITILEETLLYTDQHPIANFEIENFYVYFVLKNEMEEPVLAFTNDPNADTFITKQGFSTDLYYEKDLIHSIASESGFIKLNQKIDTKLKAYMTYRYIENYYEYKDINLNPSLNSEILGKKVIVYTLPNIEPPEVPGIGPDTLLNSIDIDYEELVEILEWQLNLQT